MFTAQVINRVNGSSQTTGSQRTEPGPEEAGLGREGRSRAWRRNRGFDHTLMCSCSDLAVVVEGKPGKISNVPVSMTIRQAARRHLTPHLAVWWRIPALRAFLLIAKEPNTTCNRVGEGRGRGKGGTSGFEHPDDGDRLFFRDLASTELRAGCWNTAVGKRLCRDRSAASLR